MVALCSDWLLRLLTDTGHESHQHTLYRSAAGKAASWAMLVTALSLASASPPSASASAASASASASASELASGWPPPDAGWLLGTGRGPWMHGPISGRNQSSGARQQVTDI